MHKGVKFNIAQHGPGNTSETKFVVIDGQRTDSGNFARGAKAISQPTSRADAIALANELDRSYIAGLIEALARSANAALHGSAAYA